MDARLAIGLVELTSIARGILTCDLMAKKAPVEVLRSQSICPGKFIVLVAGDEESVRESMDTGIETASTYLVDQLFIPNLHPQVVPAITGTRDVKEVKALGVIETFTVATTIMAADAACKAADIELLEVRLGTGLGGKAFLTLTGELHMVEAAIQGGTQAIEQTGLLLRTEVFPSPHTSLVKALL